MAVNDAQYYDPKQQDDAVPEVQLYNVTVYLRSDVYYDQRDFKNATFEMVADDSLTMKTGKKTIVIPWHSIVWYEYEKVES